MIHGLWVGYGKRRVFFLGAEDPTEHDGGMKALVLLMTLVMVGWADEENSAQRLENAQQGVAEGSWPRKPDDRLSPLSGKMKESREISMRYFSQEKEFHTKAADGWGKEAALGRRSGWEGTSGRSWEKARWEQGRDWASSQGRNEKFQPDRELTQERTLTYREVEREPVEGWASRSSRLAAGQDGSVRMYEGRLIRVRQHVQEEPGEGRELGAGRRETFSPLEVEKMLSEPVGETRGSTKAQSPAAFPLAAADN